MSKQLHEQLKASSLIQVQISQATGNYNFIIHFNRKNHIMVAGLA